MHIAGNVASDVTISSLEYATATLGTQLIVVLGHKRCGVVRESINNTLFLIKLDLFLTVLIFQPILTVLTVLNYPFPKTKRSQIIWIVRKMQ